jgi:hypothetical protein
MNRGLSNDPMRPTGCLEARIPQASQHAAASFTKSTPFQVTLRASRRVPAARLQQIGITHMTKWILGCLVALPLLFATAAFATGIGTPDEAKAMAVRAGELLKTEGPEKAFPEFNTGTAFHDRDLYVMVYDQTGKCVSHGANAGLIGKSLIDLKDTDGKFMIKDLVAVQDAGWIDYQWPNPATKKIAPKTTYVVRVGDYHVGVGAYK